MKLFRIRRRSWIGCLEKSRYKRTTTKNGGESNVQDRSGRKLFAGSHETASVALRAFADITQFLRGETADPSIPAAERAEFEAKRLQKLMEEADAKEAEEMRQKGNADFVPGCSICSVTLLRACRRGGGEGGKRISRF